MAETKPAEEMAILTARMNGHGRGLEINTGVSNARSGSAILPTFGGNQASQYDEYVKLATKVMEGDAPRGSFLDDVVVAYSKAVRQHWTEFVKNAEEMRKASVEKAIAIPADFLTYAR